MPGERLFQLVHQGHLHHLSARTWGELLDGLHAHGVPDPQARRLMHPAWHARSGHADGDTLTEVLRVQPWDAKYFDFGEDLP